MCHNSLDLTVLLRPVWVSDKGIVGLFWLKESYLIQVNMFGIITSGGKSCLKIFIVLIILHSSDSYIFNILENKVRTAMDGS